MPVFAHETPWELAAEDDGLPPVNDQSKLYALATELENVSDELIQALNVLLVFTLLPFTVNFACWAFSPMG